MKRLWDLDETAKPIPFYMLILRRLFWRCPSAIIRSIVSIFIWITIQVRSFWFFSHVQKKILKRMKPSCANVNPSSSISMPTPRSFIDTSPLHVLPSHISDRSSKPNSPVAVLESAIVMIFDKFHGHARSLISACSRACCYFSFLTAAALAKTYRYFSHAVIIRYTLYLVTLFFFALPAYGQGVRFSSTVIQQGTIGTATNAVVLPTGATIKFCLHPANAVPCSNLATTYTDQTLTTSCAGATQLVLDGTTTCVALPDAQNNWGVWVAPNSAGYDYTIALPGGVNRGPFNVLSQTNNLNGIVTPSTTFACSVAGLQLAVTATAALQTGAGAVVDARSCLNPASGTTNLNIPGGVRVLLSAATWTWTATTNNACITVNGDSASLVGIGQSNEDFTIAGQLSPRTVISCQNLGAAINGVNLVCSANTACAGGEVGNLMIQMGSSRTNLGGQDGFSTVGLDSYWLHDVDVYYATRDCFRFGNSAGASFYRVRGEHLMGRVCGGSSAPTGYGFHWITANGNELRFTNWKNLIYQAYDSGNTTVPYGIGGYALEVTSAANGDISDWTCNGCRSEGSVSAAGGGGLLLINNSVGTGIITNIFFDGLLEDNFNANLGTAVNVISGTPSNIYNIHTSVAQANYANTYNYSSSNSSAWDASLSASSSTLLGQRFYDSITVLQCSSVGATARPNTGIIYSSATTPGGSVPAGVVRECMDSSGRLLWQRADTATTYLVFDTGNTRFFPNTDNTFDWAGNGVNLWRTVGAYMHQVGTALTSSTAGAASVGTTANPFGSLWLGTAATNNFKFQPAATAGARIITITDPVSPTTVGLPLTIANSTATMTAGAITAATCQAAITVAATGVATTDSIVWSYATAPTLTTDALLTIAPYVTSGNVNFTRCNPTNASITGTAIVINWRVIR